MKLYDLLRAVTHQNYKILYMDINFMNEVRELEPTEYKNYLEYTVVSIDENWTITIKGQKI